MLGWHYTTGDNWEKIKTEGLKPYPISKPTFKAVMGVDTVNAIWIWRHRFEGRSHFGSILYQMAYKNTDEIVLLMVDYDPDDIMGFSPEQRFSLNHSGVIQTYTYHDGSEKSWLMCHTIKPEKIKLFRRYNIKGLVELYDEVLDKEQGETNGFRFDCSGRDVITRDKGSIGDAHQVEAGEAVSRSR